MADSDSSQLRRTPPEIVTHEPMVNWFSPTQLLATGVRTLLAGLFGSYADRRDVEAALYAGDSGPVEDYSGEGSLWIDYVADTGDGWTSTYAIASLAGAPVLECGGETLPRGRLLVVGGDQVYPTPAANGYRTRFLDPFGCAFPHADGQSADLYAVPGNHDWYDGLSSFTRIFCDRQPIGGWQTRQRRSYFALKLPYRWWLWGTDIQLDSNVDIHQLDYFRTQAEALKSGDRVLLCTAEPCWIDEARREPERGERRHLRFKNLTKIENLVHARGATLGAVIAGDLHHYARYDAGQNAPQRITCGGGGAYLLGTHQLPTELALDEDSTSHVYRCAATYPSREDSGMLRLRALVFPFLNPVFALFLGSVYCLYAWILQSASKVPNPHLAGRTLMESLVSLPLSLGNFFYRVIPDVYWVIAHSPGGVLFTVFPVFGCLAFTAVGARCRRTLAALGGALHGAGHVAIALLLLWGISHLNLDLIPRRYHVPQPYWIDQPLQVLLFTAEILVAGGFVGALLFGFWLVLGNLLSGWHEQEVFSSQSLRGYKSFLRMRLNADSLTIYPVGLKGVPDQWMLAPGLALVRKIRHGWWWARTTWVFRVLDCVGAHFLPTRPMQPMLIEAPIVIANSPADLPHNDLTELVP